MPLVSTIIPCRNEEKFIGMCLKSLLANDYPKDRLEVLVVDGMSEDGTRNVVTEYAKRWPVIKLLDNPKRITPAALNIGIRQARGDVLIRMDAHARVDCGYIRRCVGTLLVSGADNVGGIMKTVPKQQRLVGRAIALCLSHRFGVGNSYFRVHAMKPKWVDTVFGGCYRREIFKRIGFFNERLERGQDMEFNLRLKAAGGKTLLVPDIVIYYYCHSEYPAFCRHTFRSGVWAILPFVYSDIVPVACRHLVPLTFVIGLLTSVALSFISPLGLWLLAAIGGSYGALSLLASAHIAWRKREVRYLFAIPFIFVSLHVAYGLGSLWGLVKTAGHFLGAGLVRSQQLGKVC